MKDFDKIYNEAILTEKTGFNIDLKLVIDDLVSPMAFVPYGNQFLIVEQTGKILIMEGGKITGTFFELKMGLKFAKAYEERGLTGFALHPDFDNNNKFYLYHYRDKKGKNINHETVLAEYVKTDDGADMVREILTIDQPYTMHEGGCLNFGKDGMLYLSTGDGGHKDVKQSDPHRNGQNLKTLLGNILRVDVDSENHIPKDNPFKNEIWAYGLRNSWMISFDRDYTERLFGGDVGSELFEEVNIIEKGGNYGWSVREGFEKTPYEKEKKGETYIDPIWANSDRKWGRAVIGGYVARNKDYGKLFGTYIFGNWSKDWAKIESSLHCLEEVNGKWKPFDLTINGKEKWNEYIIGFGEDANRNIYVFTKTKVGIDGKSAKIYLLDPKSVEKL